MGALSYEDVARSHSRTAMIGQAALHQNASELKKTRAGEEHAE